MALRHIWLVVLALVVAGIPTRIQAQVPPPPPASPTIWSFLGIPQGLYKVHGALVNRRGNVPRLEKKPPLKAIADVANLKSDVPAIKAAAEIKQAEDLKPQKVKAIKYLATIGCGCYDKDEKVTKALLAALEDCTEEVRLEAVRAVSEAASSEYCQHCKQRSCCNEKLVAQLTKLAYERDDMGCHVEPSERVREAAMAALRTCCADRGGPLLVEEPVMPVEGSQSPAPVEGSSQDPPPAPPPPEVGMPRIVPPIADEAEVVPAPGRESIRVTRLTSSRRRNAAEPRIVNADEEVETSVLTSIRRTTPTQVSFSTEQEQGSAAPVYRKIGGTVTRVNRNLGLVQLHLHGGETVPVDSTIKIYHRGEMGEQVSAVLKIIESQSGSATARLVGTSRVHRISPGEEIQIWK